MCKLAVEGKLFKSFVNCDSSLLSNTCPDDAILVPVVVGYESLLVCIAVTTEQLSRYQLQALLGHLYLHTVSPGTAICRWLAGDHF